MAATSKPSRLPTKHRIVASAATALSVSASVRGTAPTHVFFTTWSRRATEAENCDVNGRMLRNLLDATAHERTVQHVALVTGLKHYLGPFEAYGRARPETPPVFFHSARNFPVPSKTSMR